MTTRRQLLKVKVRIHPSFVFALILSSPRDFQRQRSRRLRYVHDVGNVDLINEHWLGRRGEDSCSYSTGIHLLPGTYKTQGSSFATGLEVSDKRKPVLIISTGSKNVDGILGGRSTLSQ